MREEKLGGNKDLRLKREMDDIDGPVQKELFLEGGRERERDEGRKGVKELLLTCLKLP